MPMLRRSTLAFRGTDMTCDSGEDYNVASVFFAEEREGRFDEVDLAEEYYFELVADEVLGCGQVESSSTVPTTAI